MRIDTTKLTNHKAYRWTVAALEYLFLALTGVYLFYATKKITTFNIVWPYGFSDNLLTVMTVVAVLRLLTTKLIRWKTLAALGLALIYCLVYRSDEYQFLLYLAVLTVGLIDIDYRKIIKVYLISTGMVYCTAVLAGMTGAITNYVFVRPGRGFRSSWGISYPTDFATKGLFLLLMLWVVWKRLPDWAMLFPCMAFIWMARVVAFSQNGTICGIMFLFVILYCIFERKVIDQHRKLCWMKRGTNLLAIIVFPLFALAMFALMVAYARGMNVGYRLNTLLSDRLKFSVESWQKHGLTAFGTPFKQIGNGKSAISPSNYNFVDSSYPLILLRYGWMLFMAICLLWGRMARNAIRIGDRRLLLALCVIAIHSFAEHHFIEVYYNILLVMPLATYAAAEDRETAHKAGKRAVVAHVLTALMICAALWLIAPTMISWIRTVLEYKGLCDESKTDWTLIGFFLGMLAFAATVVWAVDRLLTALLTRTPRKSYALPAAVLAVCACIGLGGWLYGNSAISAAVDANAKMIKADRKALKIAVKAATGKVYSGILPAAYRRQIDGISYSVFTEDDLARNIGDTFLLSNDIERSVFLNTGSMYVKISKQHALYSGDRAVIEALTQAGYHATGYYSTAHKVSLSQAAKLNKLKYNKKTGLKLSGKKRTMKKGPYFDLYEGKYTVTYELTLPKGEPRDDSVVCMLSVTARKGKKVLLTKEVTGNQFDEDGSLSVDIPFSIGNTKDMAFSARASKGKKVRIKSIKYAKTPDSDLHRYYDSKFRVVREEYYDLKGAPMIQTAAYTSFEQDYDGYGNMVSRRFYDGNNQLVLLTDGYAEVRWQYNARRQMIREAFYDTNGQPIAQTNRAAANEREYDSRGNLVAIRYYGVDGKPVITTSGYAELRREYDKDRRVTKELYYGIDGELIPLSAGQYVFDQDYDKDGNVVARRFLGEDGRLKLRADGYAEVHWQYNGLRQIIREEFYGVDGELVEISGKYAIKEREYDDAGNVIVYRYYGTDGKPVITSSGYAEIHWEYDSKRQIIRESYFDTEGLPIALYTGQYAIENEYDDAGNVSVRRFLGENGLPIIIYYGYAEVRWQYNGMRQVTREEYYGTDGEPIAINTGAASNEWEYDDAGNVTVYRYYDIQGHPTIIVSGYAELHRKYNDKRQIVSESYYGSDGEPMVQPEGHCSLEREYDDMGNISVERYYDGDGHLTVITDGYAEIHRVFNNKKQVIRESYFDVDGSPFIRAAGHSGIEQEYDSEGKLVLRRYFDAQGNAMMRIDGYAEVRWVQDTDSGVRCIVFYDLDGNEVPMDGLNLMFDIPTDCSRWYTPDIDTINSCFKISSINLGRKNENDVYTCQLEIEYRGVHATEGQTFDFWAQGSTDGKWVGGNIWNSNLVYLETAPQDGIYRYSVTQTITSDRVAIDVFDIGFRCDYWAGGSFRVKSVKIEKGSNATSWSPGV